jgi:cyclic-di-GMP-binding protein
MVNTPQQDNSTTSGEGGIKGVLEWLALAHGHSKSEDTEELLRQVLYLREAPVAPAQRVKLLDLLFAHTEEVVRCELPRLNQLSLPISRKIRQRVRLILELLETLTQDYFNTLAALFDPQGNRLGNGAQTSLRRAMLSIAWQIRIHHLVAAPPRPGLWQQLHSAFRTARRLAVEHQPGPRNSASIQRLYTNILLTAIAQPASFSSDELEFITALVEQSVHSPNLSESITEPIESSFWIDLERDFPAHAVNRRTPGSDVCPLYLSGAELAQEVVEIRGKLAAGMSPAGLGLPDFAGTHGGQGVLRRLEKLWGQPARRKFPRRRQSYRARLCSGLETLHRLLQSADTAVELSEWMVTNESPDGLALMHMIGSTTQLRVGDIVAIQTQEEPAASGAWHVCIIRWAISENPEHVEIGLQLLAAKAIAARIAQPLSPREVTQVNALILPETPPLRMGQSLIVAPGLLREDSRQIVLLIEQDNLAIHEVRTTGIDEQTSSIEIFPIQPEDMD